VNVDVALQALKDEPGLYPVLSSPGSSQALATIWINDIDDCVCGRYHEYIISIDVSTTPGRTSNVLLQDTSTAAAYACWYNNFSTDICQAQYLHSLYINSPLSIAWGREMQAFPKHPIPVESEITLSTPTKAFSCFWGAERIMTMSTKEHVFGVTAFLQQAIGLITTVGLRKVLRFLVSPSFDVGIYMPTATAQQNQRPRQYVGTLWKGLSPLAVQVWPWNAETDRLELGNVMKPTGAEAGNGAAWLKQGGFQPLSLCFVERMSGIVLPKEEVSK